MEESKMQIQGEEYAKKKFQSLCRYLLDDYYEFVHKEIIVMNCLIRGYFEAYDDDDKEYIYSKIIDQTYFIKENSYKFIESLQKSDLELKSYTERADEA